MARIPNSPFSRAKSKPGSVKIEPRAVTGCKRWYYISNGPHGGLNVERYGQAAFLILHLREERKWCYYRRVVHHGRRIEDSSMQFLKHPDAVFMFSHYIKPTSPSIKVFLNSEKDYERYVRESRYSYL